MLEFPLLNLKKKKSLIWTSIVSQYIAILKKNVYMYVFIWWVKGNSFDIPVNTFIPYKENMI